MLTNDQKGIIGFTNNLAIVRNVSVITERQVIGAVYKKRVLSKTTNDITRTTTIWDTPIQVLVPPPTPAVINPEPPTRP